MLDTERLKVSLTKNGYLKIAELVKNYDAQDILDNVDGSIPGVRLVESQVANVLSQDKVTGRVPTMWNAIRKQGDLAIESFTLLAVIFSHHRLLRLFRETSQGQMRGCITDGDLEKKEHTNLVYAMAALRLCQYFRGAESVNYNLGPLVANLKDAGPLVRKLIESKLEKCGWEDPEHYPASRDDDFYSACRTAGFIGALGMTLPAFKSWLDG